MGYEGTVDKLLWLVDDKVKDDGDWRVILLLIPFFSVTLKINCVYGYLDSDQIVRHL